LTKQNELEICAFCGEAGPLCDSHAQPRWLYRERGTDLKLISSNEVFTKSAPIGPYERLLCPNCEKLMRPYDDYSAVFFRNRRSWLRDEKTNWWVVYKYDYSRLKLFFISLLWRAAVAKHEFYSLVELDDRTLDDLHHMIETGDPGDEQNYSVMLAMRETDNGLEKLGWNPAITERLDNLKWCRFDLNQFPCDVKVSKQQTSFEPRVLLSRTPPLLVVTGPVYSDRLLQMKNHSLARQEREKNFKELRSPKQDGS
jgi:hypothetical protein